MYYQNTKTFRPIQNTTCHTEKTYFDPMHNGGAVSSIDGEAYKPFFQVEEEQNIGEFHYLKFLSSKAVASSEHHDVVEQHYPEYKSFELHQIRGWDTIEEQLPEQNHYIIKNIQTPEIVHYPNHIYLSQESACPTSDSGSRTRMDWFKPEKVTDFKHVIYNMLVDHHNLPEKYTFVRPCSVTDKGITKKGFCFNETEDPDKKIAEMYALHIRKSRLDLENYNSVFTRDLYKYYLRACVELLSKYFEKVDKYTYVYEDIELFVPYGEIDEAESRIKKMKTRGRKRLRH